MASEAIKSGWMQHLEKQVPEKKIYGTTSCTVVNNIDCTGQARVQLSLPWLPGFQPWARIAKQSAGSYFAPQIDDEVLVSFHNGDVTEPLVVGAVSSVKDPPPTTVPADALTKRKICTPEGLELEFDDALQSVTLTNTNKSTQASTKTTLRLDTKEAEISTPHATVTVGVTGDVTIKSKTITLDADTIEIKPGTKLTITGPAVTLEATAVCEIKGKPVNIN